MRRWGKFFRVAHGAVAEQLKFWEDQPHNPESASRIRRENPFVGDVKGSTLR